MNDWKKTLQICKQKSEISIWTQIFSVIFPKPNDQCFCSITEILLYVLLKLFLFKLILFLILVEVWVILLFCQVFYNYVYIVFLFQF